MLVILGAAMCRCSHLNLIHRLATSMCSITAESLGLHWVNRTVTRLNKVELTCNIDATHEIFMRIMMNHTQMLNASYQQTGPLVALHPIIPALLRTQTQ